MCFVESLERFYDVLFEDTAEAEEKPQSAPPEREDGFKA